MAMETLPPFHRTALMLDMDGTLIDLGPTPDAVVVTPGLTDTLVSLRIRLGGALAVVTGRPIETVDRLLGAGPGAVAGEQGGARRHAPDAAIERPDLPSPPVVWVEAAEALAAAFPGALLEHKARGFALHYRLAPSAGPVFHAVLRALIAGSSGLPLLPAHLLWEIRPLGTGKG